MAFSLAKSQKQFVLASVVIAVVCCGRPEPGADTEARTTTTTPRQNQAETARQTRGETPKGGAAPTNEEIYIDSISTANPLLVTGRARTFESSVSLRVRDAGGQVIAEEYVTSVGELGQHNPFEARLWIVRDPGGRVTVDAFEYSAKDGSLRSLVSKAAAYDVEAISATLVFPVGDCKDFTAFSRRIPKSLAMARLLSEALIGGPDAAEKSAGATSPFPRGSEVRSVVMRDGEVTVDFNERLQNVGGSCAALGIRESVVRTLKHLPSVKQVTITAAGSKELALQP